MHSTKKLWNFENILYVKDIQLLQSCTAWGLLLPPVLPEVIHIKPLSWLPVIARSSCGALTPPERICLIQTVMP